MADKVVLIDYYRKTNKENSYWLTLVRQGYEFVVSVVTKYEIYSGSTDIQLEFWNKIFQKIKVIQFDELSVDYAIFINRVLKRKRKQIDIADLFIAATAMSQNYCIATLNKKHFERIDGLKIVE